MVTTSNGNEILLERYPELFFLLQYGDVPELEMSLSKVVGDFSVAHLEALSTIYVCGLGEGSVYTRLLPWLKAQKSRRLIFLEEKIEAVRALLDFPEVFLDPQVVVRLAPQHVEAVIQELVSSFPCDRVDVFSSGTCSLRRFRQIRLQILRKTTLTHSLMNESLHYHKLLLNIIPNMHRWENSFLANGLKNKLHNIPAFICGAGPSLAEQIPHLAELKDRALLIAGGSAITVLSSQGVIPHLGIALDPNKEEFERLKQASSYEMPLLYASRLQPDVFNTTNAETGYIVSDTGGGFEKYMEEASKFPPSAIGENLGMEALSVTTLSLALAVEMGCNPIFFSGVDLAYTGGERYARGVAAPSHRGQPKKASGQLLKRPNIQGKQVDTTVQWVMERDCISAFAKDTPHVRFINTSSAGLGFRGIPNYSLKTLLETECQLPLDLHGLIHAQIQQLKLPPLQKVVTTQIDQMKESLSRLKQLMSAYICEIEKLQNTHSQEPLPTSQMLLLELDMQEESGFTHVNANIGPLLDRFLSRSSANEDKLEQSHTKFSRWKELVSEQIAVFEAFS